MFKHRMRTFTLVIITTIISAIPLTGCKSSSSTTHLAQEAAENIGKYAAKGNTAGRALGKEAAEEAASTLSKNTDQGVSSLTRETVERAESTLVKEGSQFDWIQWSNRCKSIARSQFFKALPQTLTSDSQLSEIAEIVVISTLAECITESSATQEIIEQLASQLVEEYKQQQSASTTTNSTPQNTSQASSIQYQWVTLPNGSTARVCQNVQNGQYVSQAYYC